MSRESPAAHHGAHQNHQKERPRLGRIACAADSSELKMRGQTCDNLIARKNSAFSGSFAALPTVGRYAELGVGLETYIQWTEPGSNRRPPDFQSSALPAELSVQRPGYRRPTRKRRQQVQLGANGSINLMHIPSAASPIVRPTRTRRFAGRNGNENVPLNHGLSGSTGDLSFRASCNS